MARSHRGGGRTLCAMAIAMLVAASAAGGTPAHAAAAVGSNGARSDTSSAFMARIKHIVVLMEENRSFDHALGWGPKNGRGTWDGLKGDEFNLLNTSDPSSTRIPVVDTAPNISPLDPDHGLPATTSKVFGENEVAKGNTTTPTMAGFAQWAHEHRGSGYEQVMGGFRPDGLPVLYALAENYAVMDRFFCSVPGPTWPNRLFAASGTSMGETSTGAWYKGVPGQLFPQRTVFDQVVSSGLQWKTYFNDTPWELWLESVAHQPQHTVPMTQFFEDAAAGTLPHYSWLNPSSGINVTTGVGSSDWHPDHDTAAAEGLYKSVYEALRASPAWNETLFVLTFDEHGGFYDHVPPPMDVPTPGPDSSPSYPDQFTFDRLGVRIPTLLISPLIPKGTVVSEAPAAQKPQSNSAYDLTSIMASVRKLLEPLGMEQEPLTHRDAWAATFEHVLSLDTPRTDCPMHLPDAPKPTPPSVYNEADMPLNGLQQHIGTQHEHIVAGAPELTTTPDGQNENFGPGVGLTRQGDVSEWLQRQYQTHQAVMAAKQQQRREQWAEAQAAYRLATRPLPTPGWTDDSWTLSNMPPALPWSTFSTRVLKTKGKVPYCLDAGPGFAAGSVVGVAPCGSGDGKSPADPQQRWVLHGDASMRPFSNDTLCLTNHRFDPDLPGGSGQGDNDAPVTLELCAHPHLVSQSWAYHGPAPGSGNGAGNLLFGDGANALGVVAA